jgi:DNA-binding response OmpR family regulator
MEDEKAVASFIRRGLKEENYTVDLAKDGDEAVDLAKSYAYDLAILDVMVPKKTGFEVLEILRREKKSFPIIFLTAKDALEDKVKGLNIGADDYLTKPFEFDELLARIRALLRRPQGEKASVLTAADLKVDLATQKVYRGSKEIDLTGKEYALLTYMIRYPNQVITRTKLSEQIWDMYFDPFSNVIDVQVARLRKKIDQGFKKKLIQTVRGRGYKLVTTLK